MITLIILIYICLSLYFSFSNMRNTYGMFGEKFEAQKPKDAFIQGFLTLPILIIGALLFVGSILFIGALGLGIIAGAFWLIQTMP
jgi:hypothetical protein